MIIAWVQLNNIPEGRVPNQELFNLIRSKTSFCTEVFLFFTQFQSGEKVESNQKQIAAHLPDSIHVLFPVRSQGDKTMDAINTLCNRYTEKQEYSEDTVKEISNKTAEELNFWNSDYAAKISQVKGSFHFYSSENFHNHEGSLFSLHINTSVSTPQIGGKSLLYPAGIDLGFADDKLISLLKNSKIAFSFGEKGSSLWIEPERDQLINYLTYDNKIMLYLCGGETTKVIPHNPWKGIGTFSEIQLDSDSCVIGFFDLACNTGFATHYTYDRSNLKWEKDNSFARNVSVAGIMDAVIYPIFDMSQIQKGMRAEITNFAIDFYNITPPAVRVMDWEVDNSQANDSYLKIVAEEFWGEISKKAIGQEVLLYFRMCGNRIMDRKTIKCESTESTRIFIFQNSIGVSNVLSPDSFWPNSTPDNTVISLLRVHKKGDKPLPAGHSFKRNGIEVPVEYVSISFAWLDHLLLVFSMFCESEKFANPEKHKELSYAISDDKSTTIATQDIHPAYEMGDISEKQENIASNNQANRRRDDAEKGDDRDGR